jgi:hypothetical protein
LRRIKSRCTDGRFKGGRGEPKATLVELILLKVSPRQEEEPASKQREMQMPRVPKALLVMAAPRAGADQLH